MKRTQSEDYRESQITTVNSFTVYIYIYIYIKYFNRKYSLKKVVCTITFYLQYLYVAGYLKRGDDTPKLIWVCISV